MKLQIFIYPLIVLFLFGCGGAKLKTVEEANHYLESNGINCNAAKWYNSDKTSTLTSPATITFANGNAIFSGESSPYTVEKKEGGDFRNQGGQYVSKDDYFVIKFCNSRIGGCVTCYFMNNGTGWILGDRIYGFSF